MGLFSKNYNKEGPGVRKNEPQKKAFFRFFELYGRNFWNLFVANLWTVLLSIPVVTVGLAQAGVTYVARMAALDRHTFVTSDFFETIKKNWKQALPIGIIDLLIAALLFFDLSFFFQTDGALGIVGFSVSFFGLFLYIWSGFYRYLLAITFKLKLYQIYKNSLLLAIGGLGRNLLTMLVLLVIYAIAFVIGYFARGFGLMILLLLILFVIPALRAFTIQFICFPVVLKRMITPYYEAHPDEDIDKRRELGLLPSAEPDDDVDWGEN